MTRTLLVMRHGRALANDGGGDAARALTPAGARDAERMGGWLRDESLIPDRVICSTARRAVMTAEGACRAFRFDMAKVVRDGRIYDAEATTLLAMLRDLPPSVERVLLIGHNPGLEGLIRTLTGAVESLYPADLAVLHVPGAWADVASGAAIPERLVRAGEA